MFDLWGVWFVCASEGLRCLTSAQVANPAISLEHLERVDRLNRGIPAPGLVYALTAFLPSSPQAAEQCLPLRSLSTCPSHTGQIRPRRLSRPISAAQYPHAADRAAATALLWARCCLASCVRARLIPWRFPLRGSTFTLCACTLHVLAQYMATWCLGWYSEEQCAQRRMGPR